MSGAQEPEVVEPRGARPPKEKRVGRRARRRARKREEAAHDIDLAVAKAHHDDPGTPAVPQDDVITQVQPAVKVPPMPKAEPLPKAEAAAKPVKAEPAAKAAPVAKAEPVATEEPAVKPSAAKAPSGAKAQAAAKAQPVYVAAPAPGAEITDARDEEVPAAAVAATEFARKRRKSVLVVITGAVIIAFLGWLIGRQIESPADIAARSSAPPASPILATVADRTLSTTVVARGTAQFGSPRPLTLAPSGFQSGAAVVTSLPKVGDEIPAGGVLLTVSGRPVFALLGNQPAYRDLGPGIFGQDVLQLEDTLSKLGMNPGTVDGLYDGGTEAAVRQLYAKAGYQPIVATAAQLEGIGSTEPGAARPGPGVQFPADEMFFVAGQPVRIIETPVAVGQEVSGPIMTVGDSTVSVAGSLPVEDVKRVKTGMKVLIQQADLGIDTKGKVTAIADGPGTLGQDQFHVAFTVSVDKAPDGMAGASVRLTIPIKSTKHKVLTVPFSAVTTGADGSPRVVVIHKGGRAEEIFVKTGLAGGGFVAVTPIKGGKLTPGERVVVGKQRGSG